MNYAEINKRFDAVFSNPVFQEMRAKLLYYRIIEDSKNTPFDIVELEIIGVNFYKKVKVKPVVLNGLVHVNYSKS